MNTLDIVYLALAADPYLGGAMIAVLMLILALCRRLFVSSDEWWRVASVLVITLGFLYQAVGAFSVLQLSSAWLATSFALCVALGGLVYSRTLYLADPAEQQ